HTAKGLEFPDVFVCGMNEGIFPSKKTGTMQAMEEERRLAFVAVTRAKNRLYLSEGGGRGFDGSPRYPSRFLLDIDPALLEYTQQPDASLIAQTKEHIRLTARFYADAAQQNLFAKGQQVRHDVFGSGTIVEVDHERSAYRILFDGMDTPRSIAFRVALKAVEDEAVPVNQQEEGQV
nr:ATP-binding domain-containing protein [Butyrivibrio sp.]